MGDFERSLIKRPLFSQAGLNSLYTVEPTGSSVYLSAQLCAKGICRYNYITYFFVLLVTNKKVELAIPLQLAEVGVSSPINDEWAMVSHFYETPFYVYAYNFAHCLVIALYQKYLEDEKNFVPKYIELLESGGKYPPKELLGKMGIDIEGEGFWEKAFTFIGSMTKELM